MAKNLWTREELILALNLYLRLPFGKLHSGTEEIIELGRLINRTPDAVAMRLNNFASVDPYHQNRGISGLTGGRKQVEPIWKEFSSNSEELLFESERILAAMEQQSLEKKYSDLLMGIEHLKGESKIREIKTRVNQYLFRQIIIANYGGKCAITGIEIPSLLIASHILPWSKHEKERLNPQNGIALNALHDKAYENGLITITPEYIILVSSKLLKMREDTVETYFIRYHEKTMTLPKRFLPDPKFLEVHYRTRFTK